LSAPQGPYTTTEAFDQSSKVVVSNYSNEILGQLLSNYSNEKFGENDRPIIRLAHVRRGRLVTSPSDELEQDRKGNRAMHMLISAEAAIKSRSSGLRHKLRNAGRDFVANRETKFFTTKYA
jgi:hypothetical protein